MGTAEMGAVSDRDGQLVKQGAGGGNKGFAPSLALNQKPK